MTNGWKSVKNVSPEYLTGRGQYEIIETNITSKDSNEFKKVFEWCEKNAKGCWSVAQKEGNVSNITWRFYDDSIVQKFKRKYKACIIDSE